MQIEGSEGRNGKKFWFKDLSVRSHDKYVTLQRGKLPELLRVIDALGLKDGDIVFSRQFFHLVHVTVVATPSTVRLRVDAHHGMFRRLDQCFKHGQSKLTCSKENDSHDSAGLSVGCGAECRKPDRRLRDGFSAEKKKATPEGVAAVLLDGSSNSRTSRRAS